jgi:E3 ubiquitin-protein ligase UBR3
VSPCCVPDCPTLQEHLVHKTFLEELMFWTVKYEFPLKVVCLLLNMLPDPDYKVSILPFLVIMTKDLIRLGHAMSVLVGYKSNSDFF